MKLEANEAPSRTLPPAAAPSTFSTGWTVFRRRTPRSTRVSSMPRPADPPSRRHHPCAARRRSHARQRRRPRPVGRCGARGARAPQRALFDLAAGTAYETPLATVLLNRPTGSRTCVNPPLAQTKLKRLIGSWAAEMTPPGAQFRQSFSPTAFIFRRLCPS